MIIALLVVINTIQLTAPFSRLGTRFCHCNCQALVGALGCTAPTQPPHGVGFNSRAPRYTQGASDRIVNPWLPKTTSAYRTREPIPAVSTDALESGDLLPPNNVTVEARARPRCRKNPSLGTIWLWLKFIKMLAYLQLNASCMLFIFELNKQIPVHIE